MRILFLSILSFLITFSAKAQFPLSKAKGNLIIYGTPTIKQDCNLGDIVEAVFYVKNISTDTVLIGQISPDCQCTHYLYPEKGIKPNSVDSITLFYMSGNTPPGPYFKKTIVDFDDTNLELNIEGNLTLVRNVIRKGQKPFIYEKKQIRVTNWPKK